MTRRGFALLTVLWLVAALSAVSAAALAVARLGADTSRNRIVLAREEWAREACAEIMLARYAADDSVAPVPATDLGPGVWCRTTIEDDGSRLDIGLASPEALRTLIGVDSLTEALLDWRDADSVTRPRGAETDWYAARGRRTPRNASPADVRELRLVRGFDSVRVGRLERLLTARGTRRINVNTAPAEVLATLPGITPGAVASIVSRRGVGRPIRSADELLSLLPPPARGAVLGRYQEFTAATSYAPDRVVVRLEGVIGNDSLVSVEHLTLVPVPGRLAVIRREVE